MKYVLDYFRIDKDYFIKCLKWYLLSFLTVLSFIIIMFIGNLINIYKYIDDHILRMGIKVIYYLCHIVFLYVFIETRKIFYLSLIYLGVLSFWMYYLLFVGTMYIFI